MIVTNMLRSFDANPEMVIPRMTFEFAPSVGSQTEFCLTIPNDDIEKAVRLPNPLGHMPRPQAENMHEIFADLAIENVGGRMSVESNHEATKLAFGFTPLLPRAVAPTDTIGFNERVRLENEPRVPQLIGRQDIFTALVRATNLQYQFGVPIEKFYGTLPVPPARLSFIDGKDPWEPRIIVTHEFENYRASITRADKIQLAKQIFDYFTLLDTPPREDPFFVTGGITTGVYGKIFSNGDGSYGRRAGFLTEEEMTDTGTDFDIRLQSGDAYVCEGHNLDQIPQPRFMAMVGVGSISRLCRERRLDAAGNYTRPQ